MKNNIEDLTGEGDATRERELIPFGSPTLKLDVKLSEQFLREWHPRWINETNLLLAQKGGYQFVSKEEVESLSTAEVVGEDLGGKIRQAVGTVDGASGRPLYAYLMKCNRRMVEKNMADHERKFNKPVEDQILQAEISVGGQTLTNDVKVSTTKGRPRRAAS